MEDNTLPPEGLSGAQPSMTHSARRAFLRRAVGIGVPVVLASVRGRSVMAQETPNPDNVTLTGSGCLSMHPSGWLGVNRFGGNTEDPNLLERQQSCLEYQNQHGLGAEEPPQ